MIITEGWLAPNEESQQCWDKMYVHDCEWVDLNLVTREEDDGGYGGQEEEEDEQWDHTQWNVVSSEALLVSWQIPHCLHAQGFGWEYWSNTLLTHVPINPLSTGPLTHYPLIH